MTRVAWKISSFYFGTLKRQPRLFVSCWCWLETICVVLLSIGLIWCLPWVFLVIRIFGHCWMKILSRKRFIWSKLTFQTIPIIICRSTASFRSLLAWEWLLLVHTLPFSIPTKLTLMVMITLQSASWCWVSRSAFSFMTCVPFISALFVSIDRASVWPPIKTNNALESSWPTRKMNHYLHVFVFIYVVYVKICYCKCCLYLKEESF